MGLGKKLDVERAGVLAWMQCLHGGAKPWIEMPEAMRRPPPPRALSLCGSRRVCHVSCHVSCHVTRGYATSSEGRGV